MCGDGDREREREREREITGNTYSVSRRYNYIES